jgi:glycosyltransferase involved in cell wall biosynthesis
VAATRHAVGRDELPVHFFTIVLNGEPFIRYHLPVLRSLPFRWHWHVVEGLAALAHDTAWSVASGGHVHEEMHRNCLSIDGTTEYLDEIARLEPDRVALYRRPGSIWDGKREMVSAPLVNIQEECLLWQLDADELWTSKQITTMRTAFIDDPARTAAFYWCDYFVGPDAVITTRWNYAENPTVEWLRTWRYLPGDAWAAHEPPTLLRSARESRRQISRIDVGRTRPFAHDETEALGAVFQHYAYATEDQVRFKERYYGYAGALDAWRRLQEATRRGPVFLGDYLPWVHDQTLVDDVARTEVAPVATATENGWRFAEATPTAPSRRLEVGEGPIVVDGVFFQDFSTTGIARVWRSLLDEWRESGFADRILFLERAGHGPRLPGLPTRSIPRWVPERSAEDSIRLQRICDEVGASLFVSTYYTIPVETASAMIVYDLIPERLNLNMSDPVWEWKRQAIEHATSYLCISENTYRDLIDIYPTAAGKPASTVLLGVDARFAPAPEDEIAAFRVKHGIGSPYILILGDRRGVDGYKNGGLVFRAFNVWPGGENAEIVCVGGHAEIEPEYRRAAPAARIHRLALDDNELRAAYSGALCLAYPSRYEGFGLPVAEAMACGCPVVTTRVSSIPEVAGEAAIYVDPDDERELAQAFDLVSNPQRRAALIEAGIERARRFTWHTAAEAYAQGIATAAARETAEDRLARQAHWRPLREQQVKEQARLRISVPPPPTPPPPGRVVRPTVLQRAESLAARRLPPATVVRLRAAKRALRRVRAPGRRLDPRVILQRVESLAARRLPPAAVVRLRAAKGALRRARATGRRRLHPR